MGKKLASVAALAVLAAVCVGIWIALDPWPARPELIDRDANRSASSPDAPGAADAASAAAAADAKRAADRAAAGEATREPAPAAVGDAADAGAALAKLRVVGRVVDERRHPEPGASVTLLLEERPPLTLACGADGRFAIECDRPARSSWMNGLAVARADGDRVAEAYVSLPAEPAAWMVPGRELEVDAGTLVLQAGATLRVVVHDARGPVAQAQIVRIGRWNSSPILLGRSDAAGAAELRGVVPGRVGLRIDGGERGTAARELRCDPGRDYALDVELIARQVFDVDVVDAESGAPVGGAKLTFSEPYVSPIEWNDFRSGEVSHGSLPRREFDTLCDAAGRARVTLDVARPLDVWASAEGFTTEHGAHGGGTQLTARARIAPDRPSVRLGLKRSAPRVVSWPLVDGELPAPPDGSVLTLRGPRDPPDQENLPREARIVDRKLVIEAAPREWFTVLAVAPDGGLGWASIDAEKDEGRPVSFTRPRAVDVTVLHADGRPYERVQVALRDQGNGAVVQPRWTGADGQVRFEGLWPQPLDAYVATESTAYPSRQVGTASLKEGDATLTCTLPDPVRGRLRIVIDGVAQLPARYQLRAGIGGVPQVIEEPEQGELLFTVSDGDVGERTIYLQAEGFLSARATVALVREGEPVASELVLRRGARVTARVKTAAPPARQTLLLERPGDAASLDRGSVAYSPRINTPNGPAGAYEWFPVEPGRWRVREEKSGVCSEEFDLAAGELRETTLDLTATVVIRGRVELPADLTQRATMAQVRLLVGDEPAPDGGLDRFSRQQGANRRVRDDGTFELTVARSPELVLRAWHPWLQPARENGRAVVTDPSQPVVLQLQSRGLLTFRVAPSGGDDHRSEGCAVWLLAADGTAPRRIPALFDGDLARCGIDVTGTFDLLIDAMDARAPLRLAQIALSADALVDLGELRFPAGVSVRIPVTVKSGGDPPRLYVGARSLDGPQIQRWMNSNGEAEARLPGLCAGRWEISIGAVMGMRQLKTMTIEVDDANDAIVPVEIE